MPTEIVDGNDPECPVDTIAPCRADPTEDTAVGAPQENDNPLLHGTRGYPIALRWILDATSCKTLKTFRVKTVFEPSF